MLQNNKYYFDYSKDHKEPIFDKFYAKNKVVLSDSPENKNHLMRYNERLIDLITAFQVADSFASGEDSEEVKRIIGEIKSILENGKTENINYSAFCQFFMVYNFSYAAFLELPDNEKDSFLYKILKLYCEKRHKMYKSHGYTDSVLQVVCDSYSHKGNSKTSIDKFIDMLSPYTQKCLKDPGEILREDDYYILPDKSGKSVFDELLCILAIKMESRNIEQSKRPDIVFKHSGHYYIFELKTMKGSGGGQNKQAVEFAYFLKFGEENDRIHYGVMLDSLYANTFFESNSPKVSEQRGDVLNALSNNKDNFFVNTAGAKLLLRDIFNDSQ